MFRKERLTNELKEISREIEKFKKHNFEADAKEPSNWQTLENNNELQNYVRSNIQGIRASLELNANQLKENNEDKTGIKKVVSVAKKIGGILLFVSGISLVAYLFGAPIELLISGLTAGGITGVGAGATATLNGVIQQQGKTLQLADDVLHASLQLQYENLSYLEKMAEKIRARDEAKAVAQETTGNAAKQVIIAKKQPLNAKNEPESTKNR